jgi:hypothetical protein
VLAKSWKDSGVPAALRGAALPETPTWAPHWPPPAPGATAVGGRALVVVGGMAPGAAAAAAAHLAPARAPAARGGRRPSIADYAAAYASRSTTPTAVVEAALAAVAASETASPPGRWFISLGAADARRAAAESTAR